VLTVRVTREDDHRQAGIEAFDHARDEVRRARAERSVGDPRAVRYLGVGIGGEGAGALIVDQRVLEPEGAAGLVKRQELEPAHAENRAGFRQLEHCRECLAAAHCLYGVRGGGGGVGHRCVSSCRVLF
jgi:hypothetical protein